MDNVQQQRYNSEDRWLLVKISVQKTAGHTKNRRKLMRNNNWLSYGDLAWTESIISSPGDYARETEFYVRLIKEHSEIEPETLLHLACGAGINDYVFKKHFKVTGVDISEKMLEIARHTNPEAAYVLGDMRSVDLKECFDTVVIPDSIDYMSTLPELKMAIETANRHLNPGGVLLITAKIQEEFRENNFCYTGTKGDKEVTIFENNYIPKHDPCTYEATIVYLIRQAGRLSIYNDVHKLGLFSREQWLYLFRDAGLKVRQFGLDNVYESFIMGEGEYPMQVFAGVKPT